MDAVYRGTVSSDDGSSVIHVVLKHSKARLRANVCISRQLSRKESSKRGVL